MKTVAEATKSKLLADLARTRRNILEAARSLSPTRRTAVFLGSWSARQLLAHLVGWDFTNLRAARELLSAKLPTFYGYHDPDWRTYNARLVARYDKGTFTQLLAKATASHNKLLRLVQVTPAAEIVRDHGVRFRGFHVTIERLLNAELDDERVHLRQLRQFGRAARAITRH